MYSSGDASQGMRRRELNPRWTWLRLRFRRSSGSALRSDSTRIHRVFVLGLGGWRNLSSMKANRRDLNSALVGLIGLLVCLLLVVPVISIFAPGAPAQGARN